VSVHQLSDADFRAAYWKNIVRSLTDDLLLIVDMARKGSFGMPPEAGDRRLSLYLNDMFGEQAEKSDRPAWEFVPFTIGDLEKFKEDLVNNLHQKHFGDCTRFACTCMTCWAENLLETAVDTYPRKK